MALTPSAVAGGPVLSITGGGQTFNGTFTGTQYAGFTASESADGMFKGQVQIKTVADPTGALLLQLHGRVECILASGAAPGDGYEIRFEVTKSKGDLSFFFPVGSYSSIFVRDDAAGDQMDHILEFASGSNVCGNLDGLVLWDDVTNGEIKVRS